MEHTVNSTDLSEWWTNVNNEAKEHCIIKVQVLVNTRTYVLESRQFHEQIGSLGFELAMKD